LKGDLLFFCDDPYLVNWCTL